MKQIYVVGCSHTVGTELYDEQLFDNYWDFKKKPITDIVKGKKLQEFFDHQKKIAIMYDQDMTRYEKDCKKTAWPATLEKSLNKYKVINDAHGGSGIDFFQTVYNTENFDDINIQQTQAIAERRKFKKNVLNSRFLIWQITNEPRFYFTFKNHPWPIIAVDVPQILRSLESNSNGIPKWKRKIATEYFTNMFNPKEYLKEKLNFLENIIYQRIAAKKHTIIMSLYDTGITNYKPIESNYVHYANDINKAGIISYVMFRDGIPNKEAMCKYNHPNKKIHDLVAKEIEQFMKDKGLVK